MIRSSMQRVETTFDKEKRLAFKESLANRIDAEPEAVLPSVHPLLGKLVRHPSLGAGKVVEVDKNRNLLALDIDGSYFEFVLSQVESKLVEVDNVKYGLEPANLSSLVEEIPTPLSLSERSRDKDERLVTREDLPIKEDNSSPLPVLPLVGQKIRHASLGIGTVIEINKNRNLIALEIDGNVFEFGLSQVFSKLSDPDSVDSTMAKNETLIDTVPAPFSLSEKSRVHEERLIPRESLPVKPEPTTKLTANALMGKEVIHPSLGRGTVVEVDELKNTLTLAVNNVNYEFVLSQMYSKLLPVTDESKVGSTETLTELLPVPLSLTERARQKDERLVPRQQTPVRSEPEVQSESLVGKRVWHPNLGDCQVLNLDKNIITLSTGDTSVEMVFSQVQSKLIPIDEAPEHVGYRHPVPEKQAITKVSSNPEAISVLLPPIFKSLRTTDQYAFLTKDKKVTPEDAGDIIAAFKGDTPKFKTVTILWDE